LKLGTKLETPIWIELCTSSIYVRHDSTNAKWSWQYCEKLSQHSSEGTEKWSLHCKL